jgi:hypothetical protein
MLLATRLSLAQQILLKRTAQVREDIAQEGESNTKTRSIGLLGMWHDPAGWENPAGWVDRAGWNNFDNKPWENAGARPGTDRILQAMRTDNGLRPSVNQAEKLVVK